MEKTALISIVLTLYNKAPYIEETIFSIYKQSYHNWELIIVDDCSSDDSFEIAKSFCEKLGIVPKCKFIKNEKNLWVAKTFERGLKEAKGDWIAMCDGDDILMKNKLEENLLFCLKNKIDFCHSNLSIIDENNNIIRISNSKIYTYTIARKKTYKKLIYRGNAVGSTVFFSNKIGNLLKKDGFPSFLYQDWWAILYSSLKGYNIRYMDKALIYYRRCESCITRKNGNCKKTNEAILNTYKENILGENERIDYILSHDICIDEEQINRCKNHFQINKLLIKFIKGKRLFIQGEIFRLLINLRDIKYYYRVFIIQIRKIILYFIKS